MESKTQQDQFEHYAFCQYFLSTIQPVKGLMNVAGVHNMSVGCKNKDEFLEKNDDGSYKEDSLNAAWWAWQKAAKLAKKGELV